MRERKKRRDGRELRMHAAARLFDRRGAKVRRAAGLRGTQGANDLKYIVFTAR